MGCVQVTSVTNHEIEHINGDRYIQSGIHPKAQGHHLMQEGSDNRCNRWCAVMFGRKFHYHNIIPKEFGNTVKELVIS
jgi:hypothetical protein